MCDLCYQNNNDELSFLHPITNQITNLCPDCLQIVMTLGDITGIKSENQNEENNENNITSEIHLMTPSQIKAELDKHVIGQEAAKKRFQLEFITIISVLFPVVPIFKNPIL